MHMETMECIKTRRSCRKFQDEAVPHEVLEEVVGAAAYAPSWKNTQITRYIVVEDRDKIRKIAKEQAPDDLGGEESNDNQNQENQ